MYKMILGHFHVHRKSNMDAMAAILNICRKIVRTTPPEPSHGVFTIGFSLPCICAHWESTTFKMAAVTSYVKDLYSVKTVVQSFC